MLRLHKEQVLALLKYSAENIVEMLHINVVCNTLSSLLSSLIFSQDQVFASDGSDVRIINDLALTFIKGNGCNVYIGLLISNSTKSAIPAMPIQSPVACLTLVINAKVIVIVSLCNGSININAGAMGIVVGLHAEYVEVKFESLVFRVYRECIYLNASDVCMNQLPLVLGYALLLTEVNCLHQARRNHGTKRIIVVVRSRNDVVVRRGSGLLVASLLENKGPCVTIALVTDNILLSRKEHTRLLTEMFTANTLQNLVATTFISSDTVQSDTPGVATGSTPSPPPTRFEQLVSDDKQVIIPEYQVTTRSSKLQPLPEVINVTIDYLLY